jgi:hypothetical protein
LAPAAFGATFSLARCPDGAVRLEPVPAALARVANAPVVTAPVIPPMTTGMTIAETTLEMRNPTRNEGFRGSSSPRTNMIPPPVGPVWATNSS